MVINEKTVERLANGLACLQVILQTALHLSLVSEEPSSAEFNRELRAQLVFAMEIFGDEIELAMFESTVEALDTGLTAEAAVLCGIAHGFYKAGYCERYMFAYADAKGSPVTSDWKPRYLECVKASLWPWPQRVQEAFSAPSEN